MASPTGHSLCLYGHHYSREKLVWKKDLRLLYPALSYHVAIDLAAWLLTVVLMLCWLIVVFCVLTGLRLRLPYAYAGLHAAI